MSSLTLVFGAEQVEFSPKTCFSCLCTFILFRHIKMVVCTGLAVATVLTAGAVAPAAGAGIAATLAAKEGVAAGAAAVGSVIAGSSAAGASVGASVATATAAGAITGAGAGGSLVSAGVGAVVAGTSAAGAASSGVGLGTAISAGIGSGPIGWCVLGAETGTGGSEITFDCWKPVVHDTSKENSSGMLMKDVMCHPHVASVYVKSGANNELPYIVLENIWNEKFEIQYLFLHKNNRLVCHAYAL